jgi:hypothetical protein
MSSAFINQTGLIRLSKNYLIQITASPKTTDPRLASTNVVVRGGRMLKIKEL